jgi:PAS domain S-box-containing protein
MINILLIDNEPSLLHLCKTYLERSCDLRVDFALSVRDADDKLAERNFDVIVSEHQLPWRTGLEFLKRLRLKDDPIPFILFTDYGSEDIVIEALNAGADYYVRKGGDPKSKFAELEHMIRDAVHKRWHDEAQRLRNAAFDASAVVYVITDADFMVTETNESFVRAWKLGKRSEVIGTSFQRYLLSGDVVGVISTSIGFQGKWEGELTAKREDGTNFLAYCQVSPLHNAAGDIDGYFLTILDNPKSRTVEDPDKESELRYRLLAESVSDWLSIQDTNGAILYSTPASLEISGYDASELRGRSMSDYIDPDIVERFSTDLQMLMDTEENLRLESRFLHKDGHYVPIEMHIRKVSENDGVSKLVLMRISQAPTQTVVPIETSKQVDVTPPLVPESSKQLEAIPVVVPITVDGQMGKDDLKVPTPGTIIRSDDIERLELLRQMISFESDATEDIATKGRFQDMDDIIVTILAHSKFAEEYDQIGGEPEWQSVHETFQRASASSALDRVYVLNLTSRLEVQADPLLEKAFRNLLDFTLKNDGGAHKIWMTYEVEKEGVRIIYEDNGAGIAPGLKQSLFREGEDRYHGLCVAEHILGSTSMSIKEAGDPNKGLRFEILVPLDRYRLGDGGSLEKSIPGRIRASHSDERSLAESN